MAARTAMAWIIRELRRKVHDVGPEDLESDVHYPGDTIRLKCVYYDLVSVATTPTLPRVSIWDSSGTQTVTSATTNATATTGVQIHDYRIPDGGPEGVWRAQFTGKVGTVSSAYSEEFEVRITQRLWSDDQLQDYLDRVSSFTGGDTVREVLQRDAAYKRYWSDFGDYEWCNLYTSEAAAATQVATTLYTANLVKGEFVFTAAQNKTLYAEGMSHNILLAAAHCLEELSGDPSRSSQWSRGGVTHRSQDPLKLAQHYRNISQGIQTTILTRTY